jgi:hypothetical protein
MFPNLQLAVNQIADKSLRDSCSAELEKARELLAQAHEAVREIKYLRREYGRTGASRILENVEAAIAACQPGKELAK